MRTKITSEVTECMDSLLQQTRNQQSRAVDIFSDMYVKLEIGILLLVVLMFVMCIMVRRLVVVPILKCNESIPKGRPSRLSVRKNYRCWQRHTTKYMRKIRRLRCSSGIRPSTIR